MENVGKVFAEYTGNFRDVFSKLMKLNVYLARLDDVSALNHALTDFESSLNTLAASEAAAKEALAQVSAPNGVASNFERPSRNGSVDCGRGGRCPPSRPV